MRILWTMPYLPWPTTSGGKTRQYHLLSSMAARGHRITLLVQSPNKLDEATRAALEPWLERLIVLPRRPLFSLQTLLAVAFSPSPMLVSVNGHAPDLQRTFEALLQEPWDAIQIEHSYSFQPFEEPLQRSGLPFILTEHKVESEPDGACGGQRSAWLRLFKAFDQWRYRRWEQRVFAQTSELVAATEDEAKTLARRSGKATAVVINGVDCDQYAKVCPNNLSGRLLFIGNYEYTPNLDAVEWALDTILPRLWQLDPHLQLTICGHALPDEWRERWPDPRIEWRGFVPDLRALQNGAALFFAPVRHGAGSKMKVLEAMAAGLPVITTAHGCTGLKVIEGKHFLSSEDPDELAHIIAEVMTQPARLHQLGEAGRAYVRAEHDWSVAAAQLESIYKRLIPVKKRLAYLLRTGSVG